MKTQKWYNKKVLCIPIWAVGIAILVAAAAYAQTQTLQLTTYYPAPYGEYTQLRVADNLEVLNKFTSSIGSGGRTLFRIDPTQDIEYKRVGITSLYDIDSGSTAYYLDPATANRLKRLEVEEILGFVKFGNMKVRGWPVVVKAGNRLPGVGYYDLNPVTDDFPNNVSSMKIYYGTFQNSPPVAVVEVPLLYGTKKLTFNAGEYFVMISPRKLNLVGNYAITSIQTLGDRFRVTFDGTGSIPTEFDWVAIGY